MLTLDASYHAIELMKRFILFVVICFIVLNVFAQTPLDALRYLQNNKNVHGLIVEQNNQMLYKKYFSNYNSDSLFNDQSLT